MSELDKGTREAEHRDNVRELYAAQARALMDWRKHLRRDRKKGKEILGDAQNVRLALEHAPELTDLVHMNELSHRIEFSRPPPWRTLTRGRTWNDDDDIDFACWLQKWDVPVKSEATISRIVHAHAAMNPVHPVRDWLLGLPVWDREPRIAEVLIEVLCAQGNAQYLGGVLRRFMISAVARVMKPGCKADNMIVLVGDQGFRKSSFALMLGAPWAVESNSTFGTKDAIAELDGAWIVEVGELAGLRRSEIETVKHFVSRQIDRYRPAYGHAVIDQPRACVFIGTTNEERFLLDYTGNRRFWPIRCAGRVDLKLLETSREALWAEALAAYQGGEQWYLTDAEEKLATTAQEAHRVVSEVEQDVAAFLETILIATWKKEKATTVREVYQAICGERDRENLSARRQMETAIGQAIRKCGWLYVGRVGKERRSTYQAPPAEGDNLDNRYP
jgi:putative DNA primase/helicase